MTDMLLDAEPGPPIDWQQVATSHMRHIRELAAERDAAEARCDRAVVSRLTDAMIERILDTLLDDPDFARSIRNSVNDALRAAERGEGES